MTASSKSALLEFSGKMEDMKNRGLSDFKFYPGAVSEASPEDFAKEAIEMLNAINGGNFKPLKFNDAPVSRNA